MKTLEQIAVEYALIREQLRRSTFQDCRVAEPADPTDHETGYFYNGIPACDVAPESTSEWCAECKANVNISGERAKLKRELRRLTAMLKRRGARIIQTGTK